MEREVDGRIRERFRDGDPDAARVVYRAYGSLVYAVAFRVLGDRGLCEEATQQTFLRAWRAAAGFDASRKLAPWLATIARRVAIDLYRREAIRAARPLDSAATDDPVLVDHAATDELLDVWEVRRAVSELPPEQRVVVRLQHFEGLAHEEIAARLGVAVGTVKSRSFRAHRRLAIELGHLRDGNPSPPRAEAACKRHSVERRRAVRRSGSDPLRGGLEP
jgi:RNA polymerase sigma factor (sigma-70 family)